MAVSDSDLTAAIAIAFLVVAILAYVWPGYARIRGRDLAGYWAASDGGLYEIRDAGGREFSVRVAGGAGAPPCAGAASGVRGVVVPALGKRGGVELGARRIEWKGGDYWVRQGVREAPRD